MKKTLLVLLSPLLLMACGKPVDLDYNSAVAPIFLHNVQRLDHDMERLISGEFDADHAATRSAQGDDPGSRITELEQNLNQVQQLQHSEEASKFASSLSHYYELQIGYYQQLRLYSQTQDKARQETLVNDLNHTYQALKVMPDQVLAAQRNFLARADQLH
ncbi:hypothetical protein HNP46_000852 [Pseudomonas nitritireducens]|uniref:Lipoprotein n=1 Tax=Pseudomonas nitroreducens TaxID=46680 RepID=A0A7W7KFS7_PSENT|nr:hypothetical protein [Pseudomonas nitritireducens]MBB4862015.1 hypothetical protein [Pseudomonas nitritireducens]